MRKKIVDSDFPDHMRKGFAPRVNSVMRALKEKPRTSSQLLEVCNGRGGYHYGITKGQLTPILQGLVAHGKIIDIKTVKDQWGGTTRIWAIKEVPV